MEDYSDQIEEEIPGDIFVFAVIDDEENELMPDVVSHPEEYELPSHFVRERQSPGGVCTYAFLKALEVTTGANGSRKKKISWAEALEKMHAEIEDEEGGRTALPTLSMSRPINVREERLRLLSTSKRGVKRALLIGVHYEDEEDEEVRLASCHTDVRRMRKHLLHQEGFEKENILTLIDDDRHCEPTKNLILDAMERMCNISEPGDSIFLLFSGHGGTLMNQQEYDEDGICHEMLAPGDFRRKGVGVIMDDEIYSSFVTRVSAGVHAVVVIDTCHPPSSRFGKASAIDLPYVVEAGDDTVHASDGYRPGRMQFGSMPNGYDSEEEKPKKKKKSKSKKKKSGEEDYEMDEDELKSPKSKKKKKKSKKRSSDY